MTYFAVGIGGSLGAVLRYWISSLISITDFPIATLCINWGGGFLLAYLIGRQSFKYHPTLRIGITTGLLGGFTTFSTFSLDAFQLLQLGHIFFAMLYIFSTAVGCLLLSALGFLMGKKE
ncbi:MAG: fluoride efflux transporter CrcB [Solibacillus sp.]|uniref:fluoride efflux transporter CrcB n=1 Tax=Solibacillus sp. TaxID=1909654 RepID=UPI003315F2F8